VRGHLRTIHGVELLPEPTAEMIYSLVGVALSLSDMAVERIAELTKSRKAPLLKSVNSPTPVHLGAGFTYMFPDGRPCEVVLGAGTPANPKNRQWIPDSIYRAPSEEIWLILNARLSSKDYDTERALPDFLYLFAHEFGHGMDPMRFENAKSARDSEVRADGELRANVFAMQVSHAYLADVDAKWKNDEKYIEAFIQKTPVAHFVNQDFSWEEQPYLATLLVDWLPGIRRRLQEYKAEQAKARGKRR